VESVLLLVQEEEQALKVKVEVGRGKQKCLYKGVESASVICFQFREEGGFDWRSRDGVDGAEATRLANRRSCVQPCVVDGKPDRFDVSDG
jgi:hypothetical protein